MKALKPSELREKTVRELEDLLKKEQQTLFELRRKLAFHEIKDVNVIKVQRHNIARILTILTEKRREGK